MQGKFLLVRHAETDWHQQDRNLGLNDIELNSTGRMKAAKLGTELATMRISKIVHSPLKRAKETAQIIQEKLASPLDVSEESGLIDLDVGNWQGLKHTELAQRPDFRSFVQNPHSNLIPGGERLWAARDRAIQVVRKLDANSASDQNFILVSHADIIRLIFTDLLRIEPGHYFRFRISTTSISVVDRATGRIEVVNWTPETFQC